MTGSRDGRHEIADAPVSQYADPSAGAGFPPGAPGVKLHEVRNTVQKDVRPAGPASSTPEVASVDARWQSLVEQYAGLLRATISRVCPRQLGLQV